MNEKLSSFESLRQTAIASKGYISQQIANLAGTIHSLIEDIMRSVDELEATSKNKLDKLSTVQADELVLSNADGTVKTSGKKIGTSTLSEIADENTLATESAVKSYVDANKGSLHGTLSLTLPAEQWKFENGAYSLPFTNPSVKPTFKLDIACDTATCQQLINDGVSCIRIDNDNGQPIAICIGGKPSADISAQVTWTDLS